MLAILIIILVLLGAAVVGSIYSNFLVFYSNFSESENYHKAYYASISALERGELVTKQRQPGYEGSGGFIWGIGTGSYSGSDKNLSGFSYFSDNKDETSVFRNINSKTTRIPAEGKGDVERMLSTGDSINYNMMDYENAETFLLYYDKSENNPYNSSAVSIQNSTPNQISGEIRLPGLLSGQFGQLDTKVSNVGAPGSTAPDDPIVDWQIRGNYNSFPFTIFSTSKITIGGSISVDEGDTVFRESKINDILKFNFGNSRNPLSTFIDASPTIISQDESNIKNLSSFSRLLNDTISGTQLRFSLLNLLGTGQKIYPFLEYYVDFGASVPDKYFTINGEGNYKDYQVNTIIQKPTVRESILGNFTSIF